MDSNVLTHDAISKKIKEDTVVLEAKEKNKLSSSFLDLVVASTPVFNFPKNLRDCATELVVPNRRMIDIKEYMNNVSKSKKTDVDSDATATATKPLGTTDHLKEVRLRVEKNIRERFKLGSTDKLEDTHNALLLALMRFSYLAFCKVTFPKYDVPPFVIFLFYNGRSSGPKNDDMDDIGNYTPVNLNNLEFFHSSAKDIMTREISTVPMVTTKLANGGTVGDFLFPMYDPRYGVFKFKNSTAGKKLSARIKELRSLLSPLPASKEDEKEKKKKNKNKKKEEEEEEKEEEEEDKEEKAALTEEKKKSKKERHEEREKKRQERREKKKAKEQKEDKGEVASPPLPPSVVAPSQKKEAKSDVPAPGTTAMHRVASPDPIVYEKTARPFVIKEEDYQLFGVSPLDREDTVNAHMWRDVEGETGYNGMLSVIDLHRIMAHANAMKNEKLRATTPPSFDSSIFVRAMLYFSTIHNRSLHKEPFIQLTAKNLVELPSLGTMDISRVGDAFKPELIAVAKDFVYKMAMLRETMKLLTNSRVQ